jgi:hypothetical protein
MPLEPGPISNAAAGLRCRHSARSLLWLLVSALLHVSVGLLLFRAVHRARPDERARPPAPGDVEIALFEPGPRPNFDSTPTRRTSVSSKQIPRPRSRSSVSPSSAGPAKAPVPLVATTSEQGQGRPKGSGAAKRALDLSFDGLPAPRKQRLVNLPNPEEDLERLLVPPPQWTDPRRTLDEIRAETERQEDAVANVRLGRAHPLHFDYLRDARDLLTTEAGHLGGQFLLGATEAVASWARGYLDGIADISGRKATRRLPTWADPVSGGRPDVLGAYTEAQSQAEDGATSRAAYVCLGVAPQHSVVVTLGKSSGNDRLDRLAIDSFRSAVTLRPVANDVRPGLACYAVRVSAYRMPPLPSMSLEWNNGRPTLAYPLKRITKVSVELASVDYGVQVAPPSLLRGPH